MKWRIKKKKRHRPSDHLLFTRYSVGSENEKMAVYIPWRQLFESVFCFSLRWEPFRNQLICFKNHTFDPIRRRNLIAMSSSLLDLAAWKGHLRLVPTVVAASTSPLRTNTHKKRGRQEKETQRNSNYVNWIHFSFSSSVCRLQGCHYC